MTRADPFLPADLDATVSFDVIVAIPVKNEAERIASCLQALAAQTQLDGFTPLGGFRVLLLINDSDDETSVIAKRLVPLVPYRLTVLSVVLPAQSANAGGARRRAMEAAAKELETKRGRGIGIILTTDADSRVAPDWIAQNLVAFTSGADVVAGTLSLEPDDEAKLPRQLKARGALEARYEALVCELVSRFAPEAHDPWPRHATESGATFGVTLNAYRAVGGLPELPLGEDRAFADLLRAAHFKVRHSLAVKIVTSGRLVGRAPGGCADTIRHRIEQPDAECDAYLEPVLDVVFRLVRKRTPSAPADPAPRRRLRPDQLGRHIAVARLILLAWSVWSRFDGRRASLPALGGRSRSPRAVASPPGDMSRPIRVRAGVGDIAGDREFQVEARRLGA